MTYLHPGSNIGFTYSENPHPVKPRQVLVKVKCAALNPIGIKETHNTAVWAIPGENVIGRDYSRIVEEAGGEIKNLKIGDRICGSSNRIGGRGTVASYIVVNVPGDAVMKIPQSLTFEEGAAFPLTVFAVYQCLVQATDSAVCVLGGSKAAGLLAIQLAKKNTLE